MKLGKMLGTTNMVPKMNFAKMAGVSKRDLGLPSFKRKRRRRPSLKKMLRDV